MRRFAQAGGPVRERFVNGSLQGMVRRKAPDGQVLIFDLAPDRLDRIQFGAVGREETEVDGSSLQVRKRRLDGLTVVDRVVVQHDHARARPSAGLPSRQPTDEG